MFKTKHVKRLLSILITAVMLLTMIPVQVVAGALEGPSAPPAPETTVSETYSLIEPTADPLAEPALFESTNDVYEFGGKEYKLLSNGYISCYVSVDDGSFTVLPAAAVFDPEKPASYASFRIDGRDQRFGDLSGGNILISPNVEKGVMETQWKTGDYVITQVHAIRQESGHENAWAVSLGYIAEYFGEGQSDISARLLLDTLLGENDDLPLINGDTDEPQLFEALIAPVPEYLYVNEDTDNKSFLLSYEPTDDAEHTGFPSAIVLADFGAMAGNVYDVEADTTRFMADNDSGAAIFFGKRELTADGVLLTAAANEVEPVVYYESDGGNVAIFRFNYGFTDLEYTDTANLQPVSALGAGIMPLSVGEILPIEIGYGFTTYQDYYDFIIAPPAFGAVGSSASFQMSFKHTDKIEYVISLWGYNDEPSHVNHEVILTPDANGVYTFTVPDWDYCSLEIRLLSAAGYVFAQFNNETTFSIQHATGNNDIVLPGFVGQIVADGENITVTVSGVDEVSEPAVEVLFQDNEYGDISGPENIGVLPVIGKDSVTGKYTYTFDFTLDIPAGACFAYVTVVDSYEYSISSRVFPTGKNVYLSIDAPYVNGRLRANADTVIGLYVDDPSVVLTTYPSAKIVVYENTNGTLTLYKTIEYLDFSNTSEMVFTMPANNVEVRLELTELHSVALTMPITEGPPALLTQDARDLGYGNITLIPELPALNEPVRVYINLFEGAVLDGDPTVTGATVTPVNETRLEYVFTAPSGPATSITVRAPVIVPATPIPQYSIYTKPLTSNGKLLIDFELSAEMTIPGGGGPQPVPIEYTRQAPAGATVTFIPAVLSGVNLDDYSEGGLLDCSAVTESGAIVPVSRNTSSNDFSFTMPGEPVTLTWEVWGNYRTFDLKAQYLMDLGSVSVPSDVPNTSTCWFVSGHYPYLLRSPYDDKRDFPSWDPISYVGEFVIVGFKQNKGAFYGYQLKDLVVTDQQTGEDITLTIPNLHYEGYMTLGAVADKYSNKLKSDCDLLNTSYPYRKESYDIYTFTMPNHDITLTQWYDQLDNAVTFTVANPNQPNLKITNNSDSASAQTTWYVTPQYGYWEGIGGNNSLIYSTEVLLSFDGSDVAYEIESATGGSASWKLDEVWRTANSILYKYENLYVPGVPIPTVTFRIKVGERLTSMRIYRNSYDPQAFEFTGVRLQGINMRNFQISDLVSLTYDGLPVDASRLTVNNDTELFLDMEGVSGANDVGSHFLQMRWNYLENGVSGTANYNTQVKLLGPIPPTPPGTAKYLAVVYNPGTWQYELVDAASQSLIYSKAGGKAVLMLMSCDAGFSATVTGSETRWTANSVDGNNSAVMFSSGLSARPFSGASFASQEFAVSSFYQAANGQTSVKIGASNYSLYAEYIPVYLPNLISFQFAMELKNGQEYVTAMPAYLTAPDTSKAPVFELLKGAGPLGPSMELDVMGFGGFKAEYGGIKYLASGIDLSGELKIQLPEQFTDGAMAGIEIKNLILNFTDGNVGFEGIKAEGGFKMPAFMMFGAVDDSQGFQALIDTFQHQYEFELELDAKIIKIKGKLKLGVSERLTALNGGGAIVVPDEFYFEFKSEEGIPIIPTVQVASINGAKGGFSGLIKTIDYNIDKQTIPPFDVTAGGTFKLLDLIEFDGKFTVGLAKVRTELSMSISLGGLDIPIFKEYIFEAGMRDADAVDYTLAGGASVTPKRVEIYYYSKITVELIPGVLKILEGSGAFEAALGMTAPDAWAKLVSDGNATGQFATFADYVKAMNLKLSLFGSITGKVIVPDPIPVIGGMEILQGTAEMYGTASFGSGVKLETFRTYAYAEICGIGFYVLYDFTGNNIDYGTGAGPGSARGLSVGSDALYSQNFDDGHGKVTFGKGLVIAADSEGGAASVSTRSGSRAGGTPPIIFISADEMTHTVTIPDGGNYLILTTAPKDKLYIYDPDGDLFALSVMPLEATAEQSALAYNAIETKEGALLINLGGKAGDWTLVSCDPFRTTVYQNTKPPTKISDVGYDTIPVSTAVEFNVTGLEIGAKYLYDIILQKKPAPESLAESSILIADKIEYNALSEEDDFTFSYDLSGLKDFAATGYYYPKVMLYKVTSDDPLEYEPAAAGYGYVPYENTNTKYDNTTLELLTDLNAVPGGNATLRVTFSHPASPNAALTALGDVSYSAAVYYDDTGLPAVNQNGEEIALEIPQYYSDGGVYSFFIGGLEPETKYIVEVTPMFTTTMTYKIGGEEESQSFTVAGDPVRTGPVTIPVPNVPKITFDVSMGSIENGTVYAPPGAELTVFTDPSCDIVIKKYVGFDVLDSVTNGIQLTLPLDDDLSGTFLAVTATNADGDTATEYLNILIIDAPPPLVVDVNENGEVTASSSGSFTITGQTNPNIWVASSSGFSALSGNDGKFAMGGSISGASETLYLMVSDKAGNSEVALVTLVRGSSNYTDSGGDDETTTPPPRPEPGGGDKNPFVDVKGSDWYYEAVMYAYERGLMVGTSADKFSPGMPMTRGMIVTVLYRLQGSGDGGDDNNSPNFTDVAAGAWYTDAVAWAASVGIVNGYGGGLFGPNDPITRQDLAVILTRYADFMGVEGSGLRGQGSGDEGDDETPNSSLLTPNFVDYADIAGYAKDAVERLYAAGIVNGYPDGSFKPRGIATRAEVATMLMRFLEAME